VNKALVDSMQLVLCTLSQCFTCMEVKGEPIRITQACSGYNIGSVIKQNFITYEKISKKVLSEPVNIYIQQFMAFHCSITKYLIQVKKCLSENCLYCTSHPVRLPMEHFKQLSFIPWMVKKL